MDQPSLGALMQELTPKLHSLAAIQGRMVAAMREIQTIAAFANPDLTALDDELDNIYGGAL